MWPKYLVIVLASFALTMGLYEISRRCGMTRALLGLRPRHKLREGRALVGGAHVDRLAASSIKPELANLQS